MNKTELEYMLSLADEKYIDEIFTDRIHGKRKNIFAGIGAAAAVLALICGIGFAVSRTDSQDDLVAKTTPDSILIDEPVDYSKYFLNNVECMKFPDDFSVGGDGGIYCRFDSEYTKSVLTFDTADFDNGYTQLHFDHKDEVKYIEIGLTKWIDETDPMKDVCHIYTGEKGSFLSHVSLDNCIPVERFGIDIYGTEYMENSDIFRGVIFSSDSQDYVIGTKNMSYDDVGEIMDAVLRNGISEEKFDLSKASELEYYDVSTAISLAEANTIKPFAECVPQLDSIGDMRLEGDVAYSAKRNEANELVPEYISYSYYDGDKKNMSIQYFTGDSEIEPSEYTLHINNVTPGIFEHYMEDDWLFCTIECDGFKVNIRAHYCTEEDILTFRNALADAVSELKNPTMTLAEANETEPFAGYVPQLDSIGSIPFDTCWYNNYLNGGKQLVILYSADTGNSSGNIQAVFEAGGKPSVTLKNYVRLEDIKINLVHDFAYISPVEGQNSYSISVDCGKFMIDINAVCTSDEMWTYLSEIAKAYDGSEINYSGEHPRQNKEVTLEYANEATAFSGFVPQTESIGEMFLGDVLYNKFYIDNIPVDSTLHIEYLPATSYSSQYIITEYQQDLNISDEGTIRIEELTEDMAKETAGVAAYPENNFYKFAIRCGEFNIYIVAECPEETMREYLRELKNTCPKYTALTLEEAAASELTEGYVPMVEKIGDMTLEDGYCRTEEQPDGGQLLRIKYRNTDFKYQTDRYDYYGKYISTFYYKPDYKPVGATKFDDIEPAQSLTAIDLEDSGVRKFRFTLDCGDVYIGIEALCDDTEMWEYLTALKAAAANIG